MKKVTIIFPSISSLRQFLKITTVRNFMFNSSQCSLTGEFLLSEIHQAQLEMEAVVEQLETVKESM